LCTGVSGLQGINCGPGLTSGEAMNQQMEPIPLPYASLMIFVLDDFEVIARLHHRARGDF
jgi:hypothetical protein